jgi:adenine phosphoribosyltransferase
MMSIRDAIRDVPDFPKPGILFKDITPLLQDPKLGREIIAAFIEKLKGTKVDAILGVESRGFLFGYMLAVEMNVPFIPIRKSGKLPWKFP